jgi:5-methylcytosine-specific restriction endonuclease McrA
MTTQELARRDGTNCGLCGFDVDMNATNKFNPTVDHIIPKARGGTHHRSNLQLAHSFCNKVKHDRVGIPRRYFARRYTGERRHMDRVAAHVPSPTT